jgi:hypothetical protein
MDAPWGLFDPGRAAFTAEDEPKPDDKHLDEQINKGPRLREDEYTKLPSKRSQIALYPRTNVASTISKNMGRWRWKQHHDVSGNVSRYEVAHRNAYLPGFKDNSSDRIQLEQNSHNAIEQNSLRGKQSLAFLYGLGGSFYPQITVLLFNSLQLFCFKLIDATLHRLDFNYLQHTLDSTINQRTDLWLNSKLLKSNRCKEMASNEL